MGYKKTILSRNNVSYFFDGLRDCEVFIDETLVKIPVNSSAYDKSKTYIDINLSKQRVESNVRSYGEEKYGTTDTTFVGNPLERYTKIDRLETESKRLNQKATKYDLKDIDQVKKLEFTERDIGIFSFDLASLGLVRVFEYYSPLLKQVVNSNYVVSEKLSDDKLLFYYVGTPFVPKHEVEYVGSKGGYFSNVLKRLVDKNELVSEDSDEKIAKLFYPERQEIKRHEVERRQMLDKNGKPKFATTYKKCFINIPKIESTLPRIDIIVPISYSWGQNASEIFWNSVPLVSICERLTEANIDYRVIGCVGVKTMSGNKKNYGFVNIKNDNQPLDKNQLSMITSDMRFFRYNFFRLAYAMQYDSGFENYFSTSIGQPITDRIEIKQAYIDYLSKQSSESDRSAALNSLSKIVLPVSFSETQSENAYRNVIREISAL